FFRTICTVATDLAAPARNRALMFGCSTLMSEWKTHRGDEWWYSDQVVEASASFNLATVPPAFSISIDVRCRGEFTAGYLFLLLRRSSEQLPEFELWCHLDKIVEPILDELADDGRIQWELLEHPFSREARI